MNLPWTICMFCPGTGGRIPTMLGWGEPCLCWGDMWPGPGDMEWTGDMAGDVVWGGRPRDPGLKGFSSWILGEDMWGWGDWTGKPEW